MRLNAIARQAGVGQGTLYRHFPTREDLLAEVYREDVEELVAAAPALLADHPPLDALARWLDRVADYAQVKRGVFAAVEAGVSAGPGRAQPGPIGEALTALLDAGKADGTVRADVDARDVILLIGYLTRLDEAEWDTRARHLLAGHPRRVAGAARPTGARLKAGRGPGASPRDPASLPPVTKPSPNSPAPEVSGSGS